MRRRMLAGLLALLPAGTAAADYRYTPGHRDPFLAPATSAPPPVELCQGMLCRHDVAELKVTGIVTGMSQPLAMLEDPATGEAQTVRLGARVGMHNGRISKIASDRVVVTEVLYSSSGPHTVERELRLYAAE